MRSKTKETLIREANDFYRETHYIPSNYDYIFHTDFFSSPVTVRKKFGSWDGFLDEAFHSMQFSYQHRMFYGGYGQNFKPVLPVEIEPIARINGEEYNILGDLTYDDLSPKEAWVTKKRMSDIIEVLQDDFEFVVVPAEKRFLFPFLMMEDEHVLCSFDTPHISGHYRRVNKVMEYFNKSAHLINANGVKKNHILAMVKGEIYG